EDDPLLEYLLQFRTRMGQARRLLTDEAKTAFFFVTLPEALPIAVITRFIGWFREFGIPVGGVIVNMVLDREALGANVPEFVRNRLAMQDDHLRTIREKFDGSVRAVVPLFDQEIRGLAMLDRAGHALFAWGGRVRSRVSHRRQGLTPACPPTSPPSTRLRRLNSARRATRRSAWSGCGRCSV